MIQFIKKEEQFNDVIFGGRFLANKPVFNGENNIRMYRMSSDMFPWMSEYEIEDLPERYENDSYDPTPNIEEHKKAIIRAADALLKIENPSELLQK